MTSKPLIRYFPGRANSGWVSNAKNSLTGPPICFGIAPVRIWKQARSSGSKTRIK